MRMICRAAFFSRRAIYLGHCFLVWGFLFGCLSPLLCCFLLLCFFVSLLFCFFAFLNLLSCFSVFLLFCFSGFSLLFFLLLRFLFASLLLCFSVFLLVYFCFLFLCFLVLCFVFFLLSLLFPQQRKLGVFSHSKGSGEGRSSQIRTVQGWEPGSGEGSPFPRESLGAANSARRRLVTLLPCKETCSWNPCLGTWGTVLGTLACELVLANLAWEPGLANLAWKPVPRNLAWKPLLANLFLETFFATFSWKPAPGNPAWEPVPGNLAWQLFLEPLLGNLAWEPVPGNLAWESFLVTLLANLFLENLRKSCSWGGWRPQTYAAGKNVPKQVPSLDWLPGKLNTPKQTRQVSRKRFPSKVKSSS